MLNVLSLILSVNSALASPSACKAFRSEQTIGVVATSPLKTYLALGLTFPQSGELISIGLTAARILDPDAWVSFEDPSEKEVDRLWDSMVRAHAAWGLEANAGKDFVRLVAKGFVDQAGYGALTVTKLLAFVDRHGGEGLSARKKKLREVDQGIS